METTRGKWEIAVEETAYLLACQVSSPEYRVPDVQKTRTCRGIRQRCVFKAGRSRLRVNRNILPNASKSF